MVINGSGYHGSVSQFKGFFLIFPLVYHFIQTLPLINYVVINPCCCSYLFHLNKFVLARWLRTKAFLNSCRCKKWPQVNNTFNPVGISHFSSSKIHVFLFCNNMSLPLHTCCEFLFGACLMQPVLRIQRLGAVGMFGLGWLSLCWDLSPSADSETSSRCTPCSSWSGTTAKIQNYFPYKLHLCTFPSCNLKMSFNPDTVQLHRNHDSSSEFYFQYTGEGYVLFRMQNVTQWTGICGFIQVSYLTLKKPSK